MSSQDIVREVEAGMRPSATDQNDIVHALRSAQPVGSPSIGVRRTATGFSLHARPPRRWLGRRPFQSVFVAGRTATITGTFGPATPYLWVDVSAATAEWKTTTQSPMPDGVEIYDGRLSNEGELHVTRFG